MDISPKTLSKPTNYKIKIRGQLKEKWADWLDGQMVKIDSPGDGCSDATIYLVVPDQAALRGALNKIWDLNLTLLAVDLMDEEEGFGGTNEP